MVKNMSTAKRFTVSNLFAKIYSAHILRAAQVYRVSPKRNCGLGRLLGYMQHLPFPFSLINFFLQVVYFVVSKSNQTPVTC